LSRECDAVLAKAIGGDRPSELLTSVVPPWWRYFLWLFMTVNPDLGGGGIVGRHVGGSRLSGREMAGCARRTRTPLQSARINSR